MVLHIPHASPVIPREEAARLLLSPAGLAREVLSLTDWHTDELFGAAARPGDVIVRFPVSRLVLDPERFTDDEQEPMAAIGMGVIYTRTSRGAQLREAPSPRERERLLDAWYRPHHARLEAAVREELARCGRALIVDCHSFPEHRLPFEFDHSEDRPDICIGTDAFHTPPELAARAVAAFQSRGYTVKPDSPFSGAIIPHFCYRKDTRVASLMVELNRRLYMDETTANKAPGFIRIKETLDYVLQHLFRYQ